MRQRPARRRRHENRRRPPSLFARIPSAGELATALARAGRRALPSLITAGAVACTVGLGVFGHRWVTTSPRFAVERPDVRGHRVLSAGEVRALSGIAPGENVFGINPDAVSRAVEAEPWIAEARVRRELPNRIIIEIEEREAVALVELDGMYLVDAEGAAFKRADIERKEGAGLPVITGISREEYLADVEVGQARIRRGLEAAALFRENQARPALGEIHMDERRGVTLTTYEGAVAIQLGDASESELRARLMAFDRVWSSLDADDRRNANAIYIDSTALPQRVTVAFAGR